MNTEAILARLQSVQRRGSKWTARCPVHPDRSPSLCIRQGEEGRVLLYCFAGCTVEAICAALGLTMRDLFNEPRTPRKPEPPIVRDVRKELAGLRGRLTPSDRERAVTIVVAHQNSLDGAITLALALAV